MSYDPTNCPRHLRLVLATILPMLGLVPACDETVDPEQWELVGDSDGAEADSEDGEEISFRRAYPYMVVWEACNSAYDSGDQVEQCIVNVCLEYGCT